MDEDQVILVDEEDREIGTAGKLEVHLKSQLHRAFSIFVFNSKGSLMIQRRAAGKYHSGGLWSNTCCSHPKPGRDLIDEARQKLQQEMGFQCDLHEIFHFIYKAQMDHQLTEHELDHVFIGNYDSDPTPAPEEVQDWKWIDPAELRIDLQMNPDAYSYWLKICLDRVLKETGRLGEISSKRV